MQVNVMLPTCLGDEHKDYRYFLSGGISIPLREDRI